MEKKFRVLYVAHRYHTNQIPIMKGWSDLGVEVFFLAQYEGVGEVHDYVVYKNLVPSLMFRMYSFFIDKSKDKVIAESLKIKNFIPSLWNVLSVLKNIKPDIVIIREHYKGNAIVSIACKMLHINKVIMYVQTPLYGKTQETSKFRNVFRKIFFPAVVFSPVFYKDEQRGITTLSKEYDRAKWFVPLVYEQCNHVKEKKSKDGILNILDTGKYRNYKNHFFLVDAIAQLQDVSRIKVTIIGQLSNDSEKKYYDELAQYIADRNLESVFELKGHVPYDEMQTIYNQNDILVLCSKNETAGMVILEGMAHGLCVISSINCGLASYLDEFNCGYTYSLEDPVNLTQIIEKILESPEEAEKLGLKAYEVVKKQLDFKSYLQHLNQLTKAEYNFDMVDYLDNDK